MSEATRKIKYNKSNEAIHLGLFLTDEDHDKSMNIVIHDRRPLVCLLTVIISRYASEVSYVVLSRKQSCEWSPVLQRSKTALFFDYEK